MQDNQIQRDNKIIHTLIKHVRTKFIANRVGSNIVIIYNLIIILLTIVFYPIMPILLNYPPNNEQVSSVLGTSNYLQYVLLCIYSCSVGTIFLLRSLKDFKGWEKLDRNNAEDVKKLRIIRKKSMNLPVIIFMLQIVTVNLPIIIIGLLVTTLNNSPKMVVIKVIFMTISLFSLAAVSAYIFSKRIFKTVLLKTFLREESEGYRINLKKNIFIQITPMLIVAILFTVMIGYSRVVSEKGDLMYSVYKSMLTQRIKSEKSVNSTEKAFKLLEGVKFENNDPIYFVKSPQGQIITSDNSKMGGYFIYYISHPYNDDRMFDLNAETQGIVLNADKKGDWKVGIIFRITSDKTIGFFIFSFFAVLLLNVLALYYFSKSLSSDISLVAESLTDIANGENVNLDKKLPVTSNDEIGDLVMAFNKIQEKEKEHVEEIQEQQAIIGEQERLASLGQMIGGIAHNMRTPIMSISGAVEGLRDLVNEYKVSIGDKSVTEADHFEIVKDMHVWLDKIDPFCSHMTEILTAVKEQTAQSKTNEELSFTIEELTKRVELLMNNELIVSCCVLRVEYSIDMDIKIPGDISILVQVLNNLITNAVQSYEETGHDVELKIQREDNALLFIVKDFGPGIANEIKDRLFKEMVTTKGKSGTGLGLFISYSNIKAHFMGKMWFESEEGKGTTFYISIPINAKQGDEKSL